MRVKYLLGTAGLAVMVTLAVPGVSNANRGGGTTVEPVVQPVDEATPVEAPVEATPVPPVDEVTPAEPIAEEPPAPPLAAPTRIRPVTHAPIAAAPAPVVEPVLTTEAKKISPPDPGGAKDRGQTNRPDKEAGACHMDSYESTEVASLDNEGEANRAKKVDRNGNGTVCRKEIPGRGNTGQGTNIKDDQAR